jgi:hypothetical protein
MPLYRPGLSTVYFPGEQPDGAAQSAQSQPTILIHNPAQKELVNTNPIGPREQAILDGIAAAKARAAVALEEQANLEAQEAALANQPPATDEFVAPGHSLFSDPSKKAPLDTETPAT